MIGVWDGRYMNLCGGVTVWFTDGYLNILPKLIPVLSLQRVQLDPLPNGYRRRPHPHPEH